MIFFEKNLLLQSDEVFDFESNGSNISSLAPPGAEKKIIFNFFAQNDVMIPLSAVFLGLRDPLWPEISENLTIGLIFYVLQNGHQRFVKFDP